MIDIATSGRLQHVLNPNKTSTNALNSMTHISDDVWSVNQKQPRAQFKVVRSLEGALLLWISMLSIYLCC
jgi:hypothetical protein